MIDIGKKTGNNDTASSYLFTQKVAVAPRQLQWVIFVACLFWSGRCTFQRKDNSIQAVSVQKHACVRSLYFAIIEKSINRWRPPGFGGGGACERFSEENVFQPGDFLSLSHMTWLLNKITVSTPKGSHCTRCVWATSGRWCVLCIYSVSKYFQSGSRGLEQRERPGPPPPTPHSSFLP